MRHSIYLLVPLLSIASTAYGEVLTAGNAAMGGVGVASSHIDSAASNNPALLIRPKRSKKTVITVPSFSGEASDKDEVVDTIDDVDELFEAFENAVDAYAANPNAANLSAAEQSRDDVLDALESVDEKPITGQASILFSIASVGDTWSYAIDSRHSVIGVSEINFAPEDRNILQTAINNSNSNIDDLIETTVNASAVVLKETVLSIAKGFTLKGRELAIGISPKVVEVDTYFYSQGAENANTNDLEKNDYRTDDSAVNIDVGLAYFLSDTITVGIIFRDLFRKNFKTVTVNDQFDQYQTKLSSTLGFAIAQPFYNVALDVDLIPNKGLKSIEDSQFLRVGGEIDAWGWGQFRAGLRFDLKSERDNVMSAGFNLSPYDTVHIGLSSWSGDLWNGDSNTEGLAVDIKVLF